MDMLYISPLLSLVSVKLSVEPPLTLTLPLLPPVKEILYPVVSPSGLGGVQVNRILVESFLITNVKLLGAEETEGQQSMHRAMSLSMNYHTLYNKGF